MAFENILKNIINSGISFFQSNEKTIIELIQKFQKTFSELKEKGSENNSDVAIKLRQILDDILLQTEGLSVQAGAFYLESLEKFGHYFDALQPQIEKMIPEEHLTIIKDKIQELNEVIREKVEKSAYSNREPSAAPKDDNEQTE